MEPKEETVARKIEIGEQITVGGLAELLNLPVSKLIAELFKNGVMATVNEKIDYDTAQIIVNELGLDIELAKKEHTAPERPKPELSAAAIARPPVVAMMGHVDHGKTTLLDAIRGAEIAKGEAGAITQHLSAYQIKHKGRAITFLDTPGHEAFTSLREHGARLTDVAIIVVAADEGVKPQTIEAIRFARQAAVKLIVVASKMDTAGADLNRLKTQLAEQELVPEDFGGDTIVIPVSAKTKQGISELLDMVLLVADVEELKADAAGPASGLVIESHMEQGRGPVVIGLVEQGTLTKGDFVVAGTTYGKIRNLETPDGKTLVRAGPASPAIMTGFKALPDFGDSFSVVSSEKIARDQSAQEASGRRQSGTAGAMSGSELLRIISHKTQINELNVIIKADVMGSVTSVTDSLKTLDTEEVAVRVVSSGVGVINENDIHLAASTGAIIYGFHTELPAHIKRLASRDKVSVRLFQVIYELIDDAKAELGRLLRPEIVEETLGELEVKGVFKVTKTQLVAGGEVIKGRLSLPALANIRRAKKNLAKDLEVVGLKKGPQDVKEADQGELCGVSFKTTQKIDVQEGDKISFYRRQTKIRSL